MLRALTAGREYLAVVLGAYATRHRLGRNLQRMPLPRALAVADPKGEIKALSRQQIFAAMRWGLRLPTGGEKSTCLIRSVILGRFLREAGENVDLVIGVRMSAAGELQGHAWLTDEAGVALTETPTEDDYRPIYRYPADAERGADEIGALTFV